MKSGMGSKRAWMLAGLVSAALAAGAVLAGVNRSDPAEVGARSALAGEARRGSLTVALAPAVANVKVIDARVPGRPLVVIDAGHGGRDPGATSVSGNMTEKALTLQLALELRDRLAKAGRVRIALTRDNDDYLELDQRAAIARHLGASLFLSIHADSAPNPLARGATIYSLSDVASDAEAARFAQAENQAAGAFSSESDGSVRSLLVDLAYRDQMTASADWAVRMVHKSTGRVGLRPEPHRFAAFHVLRRAEVPAVLFEAGYLSNVDDEAILLSPEGRARIVEALAATIEADLAARETR
ncbi:MAG TPA: N-acetylmuramoyl-L-alanine amidase [Sphingomicrobium sp.]|nr:N-acetylmuramoyl-L-alanine amidase [Sphingomicrobium sp.]